VLHGAIQFLVAIRKVETLPVDIAEYEVRFIDITLVIYATADADIFCPNLYSF
jgi:hypothetical protein